jgi:nicotinate-nucleotide--dimethylbenzimidazole phosphoribosyltransferase
MTRVQTPDLVTLGSTVEAPGARTGSTSAADPLGRLAEVADWWACVAPGAGGELRAPTLVQHRWLAVPVVTAPPVRADLDVGRFDAPEDVDEAVAYGASVADDAADDGADLILLSVPDDGIAATLLGAHLLGLDPVEALGWPARLGLDDRAWMDRVAALRDAMRAVRVAGGAPERALETVGSSALAAGSALLVQSAARRTPVLLDGDAAAVCALLAYRVTRHARGWWQAGQGTGTVLHDRLLAALALEPLTHLGVRTEDGTGARLGLAVLEAATAGLPAA